MNWIDIKDKKPKTFSKEDYQSSKPVLVKNENETDEKSKFHVCIYAFETDENQNVKWVQWYCPDFEELIDGDFITHFCEITD